MKQNIHPEYAPVTVQCACGSTFQTSSTIKGSIQVDICSQCHPFFTGKQKMLDTAGRIDRFKKKFTSGAAPAPVKPVKTQTGPTKLPLPGLRLSIKEKLQAAKDKAAAQQQAQ